MPGDDRQPPSVHARTPAPDGEDSAAQPAAVDQQGFDAAAQQMLRELLSHLPGPQQLGVDALLRKLAQMPERVQALQQAYYRDWLALWAQAVGAAEHRSSDAPGGAVADGSGSPGGADDPRFAAPEWRSQPFFRLLRATYALNARWLHDLVALAELPQPTLRRLNFALGQLIEAMAPTNFAATNPEAIRAAIASGGGSVQAGLRNLQRDLRAGDMARSAPGAFEVGRNLAITPGAVVYENAVAQLIRYAPTTERVRSRALLIVPPFINKYYILDLQPHNSFVRHALDQGLQVFMVSWHNPTDPSARQTWDDYAAQGVHEMIDVVLGLTRTRRLNALGFCVGGTLLASALAVAPRREAVASLTLLTTLLDFSDVGEIGNYIDAAYVEQCERAFGNGGLMGGAQIAASFASLRPRELVWSFYVDNYLKGANPRAFDLLHWNADSANAPGPLFAWYLRNAYLENRLARPDAAMVCGQPLDLRKLDMPAYVFAAREDHIVPWRSAWRGARCLAGRIEFVLGASGHVAGVINPASAGRRHYWIDSRGATDPDAWLDAATRMPGSWWLHWSQWIERQAGTWKRPARQLGDKRHPVIEPAPGRYVVTSART